jgi:hypothetical protein
VDRRAARAAVLFTHNPSDSGDDCLALGVRQKIDLHLDPLADPILLLSLEEHAAHTEIDHLTGVPIYFGNGAHTRWPFHMVTTCAARLQTFHTRRQSKKRPEDLKALSHSVSASKPAASFVIGVFP